MSMLFPPSTALYCSDMGAQPSWHHRDLLVGPLIGLFCIPKGASDSRDPTYQNFSSATGMDYEQLRNFLSWSTYTHTLLLQGGQEHLHLATHQPQALQGGMVMSTTRAGCGQHWAHRGLDSGLGNSTARPLKSRAWNRRCMAMDPVAGHHSSSGHSADCDRWRQSRAPLQWVLSWPRPPSTCWCSGQSTKPGAGVVLWGVGVQETSGTHFLSQGHRGGSASPTDYRHEEREGGGEWGPKHLKGVAAEPPHLCTPGNTWFGLRSGA